MESDYGAARPTMNAGPSRLFVNLSLWYMLHSYPYSSQDYIGPRRSQTRIQGFPTLIISRISVAYSTSSFFRFWITHVLVIRFHTT